MRADTVPKDPEVNRQCAIALGKRGQYDQAIICWHVVEQARPDDEEPRRSIATLAVEKARGRPEDDARDRRRRNPDPEQLSPIDRLLRKIEQDPNALANYFELVQLYFNEDRFEEAEQLLARAFKVSGGDLDVREKWEDAQIRSLRQQLVWPATKPRPTRPKRPRRMSSVSVRSSTNRNSTSARAVASVTPTTWVSSTIWPSATRLLGNYAEAIKEFQQARNDPRRKGVCLLELGRCFSNIKQYRLGHAALPGGHRRYPRPRCGKKKRALYLAGKLAMSLRERESAEKYLNALAGSGLLLQRHFGSTRQA